LAFDTTVAELQAAAEGYQQRLEQKGGDSILVQQLPKPDFVKLGLVLSLWERLILLNRMGRAMPFGSRHVGNST
jgi:hypothetical protein